MKNDLFATCCKFGIRKLAVGVGSVIIGAVLFAAGPVSADNLEPVATGAAVAVSAPAADADLPAQPVAADDSQPAVPAPLQPSAANTAADAPAAPAAAAGMDTDSPAAVQPAATANPVGAASVSEGIARRTPIKETDSTVVMEASDKRTNPQTKQVDLSEELDKLKNLKQATIHVEFKLNETGRNLYSVFSVSSSSHGNEYFVLGVYDGVAIVEGRGAIGEQFYDNYNNAPLRINAGEWNTMTFTVSRPNPDSDEGQVQLYVNGVLSRTSTRSGKFLSDMPDLTNVQIGATVRSNWPRVWGGDVEVRSLTVYNRVLSEEDIAQRNQAVLTDAGSGVQLVGIGDSLRNVEAADIRKVRVAALDGRDYDAYDIVLRDKNNQAIQPDGPVLVRVQAAADRTVDQVFYVTADQQLQELSFDQLDQTVEFQTDHFSIYAVAYKAKPAPQPNPTNAAGQNQPDVTPFAAEVAQRIGTSISSAVSAYQTSAERGSLPATGSSQPQPLFLAGLLTALTSLFILRKKEEQ